MHLTVVIPTRNKSETLSHRLTELLNQTITPAAYDILVVDNGSTDATCQILREFGKLHNNFRWVREPVSGRSHARNAGIRLATGDLLLLLDDDIEVPADHLEVHIKYHLNSAEDIAVIGNVIDVSPIRPNCLEDYFHSKQLAGSCQPPPDLNEDLLGLYFITQDVSLRKRSLERIATIEGGLKHYFDPEFQTREDADLGFRLMISGTRFIFPCDIVSKHHHPRNLQAILDRSFQSGFSLVRLFDKHPVAKGPHLFLTKSRLLNHMLLFACYITFPLAWIVRPVGTSLLRKVIGAYLLHARNRGFQAAYRGTTLRHS